jgi:integrase/recombinase XerD
VFAEHRASRVGAFKHRPRSLHGQAFHGCQKERKGKKVSAKVFLPTEARESLDRYLDEVRGRDKGPLFLAKGGGPLLRQDVDTLLKAIANQANAQLDDDKHIHLSAHVLRHTMLRRAAEKY